MIENETPDIVQSGQEKQIPLLEATETTHDDLETSSEQLSTKPKPPQKCYRNRRLEHKEEPEIMKEVDENVKGSKVQTPEGNLSLFFHQNLF